MVKILHTADWHIGKWLDNHSRLQEQKEVLDEICAITEKEKVDLVLIAGDLFDTAVPSAEALELFYKTVRRLANNGKRPVVAIAGNHDQPDRIEAPDHLARECGIIFIGYPNSKVAVCDMNDYSITRSDQGFVEIKLSSNDTPVRIILTPYANELRLKTYLKTENPEQELRAVLETRWKQLADTYCDNKGVNLLCTHLFFQAKGAIPAEEPEDEKPILFVGGAQPIYPDNIPDAIQYVAVGHLHRYQVIDDRPCPIVYSSSPLAYSFAEADQSKYVALINAIPDQPVQYARQLLTKGKKLLRHRFENTDDALVWLKENQDALVEITLVADEFITVAQRRQLQETHSGIIAIIPEIRNRAFQLNQQGAIDLNRSIDQLFIDYFQRQKSQLPNDDILELFREVLAVEP